MSYNRGIKRDSYGNRNMNNRIGGGGSSGRMGNMGNMGSGNVNPWEGGMMPGGRGILPTPNNNLSINSPQAQLAIASNLLSNLLRSQQEPQPQVPPSLLSLGNSYGAPNYPSQQSYSQGRISDRLGRNIKPPQRPQPYNKMGNRPRDGPAGRRGQQNRSQSGNQRQSGNKSQNHQRNDKSSKENSVSKQNQTVRKEQQDKTSDKTSDKTPDKTSDKTSEKTNEKAEASVALSEENEETEESKKREWKDEKKELSGDKKDGKTLESSSDKDDSGDKGSIKKTSSRHAESRFAEVPTSNMYCHVCNKHMWDGFSFDNHLRGRAHQLMMDKLDESYKLKVELMRHELRVAEEQRELSLANSKRRGKKLSLDLNVREYCTMCDLNFLGTLSNHRKGDKHQQLKTFLHPRCLPCSKEFPSRIEYDEHCFTPIHMKNALQSEEQKKTKKKDKLSKGESEVRTADEEDKDVGSDTKIDKADESVVDNKDFITEIPEQVDVKLKIPSYKHCRTHQLSVGKGLVNEITGYHCDKCRRFMPTEEDMIAHVRSITHYRSFIHEIKTLQAAAAEAAKEKAEQEKKEAGKDDDDKAETSEPDSKRPKIEEKEKDETADDAEDKQEDEEGNDKYDPAEANETDEENAEETVEDDKEEITNDNEDGSNDNEIIINDADVTLDETNENEDEEEEEKKEPATKSTPSTPRSNQQQATRGTPATRARGNRARRSRR